MIIVVLTCFSYNADTQTSVVSCPHYWSEHHYWLIVSSICCFSCPKNRIVLTIDCQTYVILICGMVKTCKAARHNFKFIYNCHFL